MKYHIEQNGKTACGKALKPGIYAHSVEDFKTYPKLFACKACAASLTPAAGNTPSYSVRISDENHNYLIENFGTISNGVREVLNRHREQVAKNAELAGKLEELGK